MAYNNHRARKERSMNRHVCLSTRSAAAILGAALAALYTPPKLAAEKSHGARFVLAWGTKGDKPGEFFSPIGIAISSKNEVYVTDLNNARLQKFTTEGKYVGGFDLPRDNVQRKSSQAGGIAVDPGGLIYLTFMVQDKVRAYTDDGKLVREWGRTGQGDGELRGPGGIALGRDGSVYVADQRNHRIQKFSPEGKFLAKWGSYGSGPGQFGAPESAGSRFGGPHFLALDRQGRIYTTEGVRGRVQQFSPEGKPLLSWGNKGDGPGGFGALKTGFTPHSFGPVAVYVDGNDRIWVSSLNDRVQQFTTEGQFVLGIGGPGKVPGRFARPHGLATDSRGFLYVADAGNQRIQKFEIFTRLAVPLKDE
jgi:DNA-binding beta-propeller fold protein YncE